MYFHRSGMCRPYVDKLNDYRPGVLLEDFFHILEVQQYRSP